MRPHSRCPVKASSFGNRFLVIGFSVFFATVAASTNILVPHAEATKQARTLIDRELAPKVPGASVSVMVAGASIWSESFGFADLSNNVRVSPTTRFRIGSISKSLTSAGLALLVERGQLNLDVPIQTYIADYPKKDTPITVRMLAGHLSGIRDYRNDEALSNISYPDSRSRLKVFDADPLIAPPTKKFSYASYNWEVIETAMERAAHQDFVSFMEANVLGPLHLDHTCAEGLKKLGPFQAKFYEINESGAFILGPEIDVRYAWAAGGYLSTADDLARFGFTLMQPGFLSETSLQMLFSSQKTSDGNLTDYGMGWYVYPHPKVIYHTGWTVGGLSILLMIPDKNVSVAIVTNRGNLNITEQNQMYFNIEEIGYKLASLFTVLADSPQSLRE